MSETVIPNRPADVILISMPWTIVRAPSIQLGLLKSILDSHGIKTQSAHLYLEFFNFIARRMHREQVSIDKFESFGGNLGEWTFSIFPFRIPINDDEIREVLFRQGYSKEWVNFAFHLRDLTPVFLEQCVDMILAASPRIVGFSTTFQQNVPSLVLSKMLKSVRPDLRIVFGGANCEGLMGEALHRCFPWIDVVVRGEGERVVPSLFRELLDESPVSRQPGLCFRQGCEEVICEDVVIDDREERPITISVSSATPKGLKTDQLGSNGPFPMDLIPLPTYDDYFQRLARGPLGERGEQVWLPYESARGCWWAIKHVCTFCAANSQYLSFRSRTPVKVAKDVVNLSRRYGSRRVWFVDNIMEERYLRELFPLLRRTPVPMFVETRAHVSKEQLKTMREAGVVMVQLGIESFSSLILKLMEKGTTAIQNIRVLKWCAEFGIHAFYNIIYGFPGEAPEEYERMADAVQSLTHLEPPNFPVRLRLDRFSPYHRDPDSYGIEILGPYQIRRLTYNLPVDEIEKLEYFFSFRYKDGRNPETYVRTFIQNCALWKQNWRRNVCSLSYHQTPHGLRIYDTRWNTEDKVYELDVAAASLYLACEAGTTARKAWETLSVAQQQQFSVQDVANTLMVMSQRRLMFADDGRFLALAIKGDESQQRLHEECALSVERILLCPNESQRILQ